MEPDIRVHDCFPTYAYYSSSLKKKKNVYNTLAIINRITLNVKF